ncbi:MAG: hypothetical protein PVSMB7_23930 [Chloroflexota bacterium]
MIDTGRVTTQRERHGASHGRDREYAARDSHPDPLAPRCQLRLLPMYLLFPIQRSLLRLAGLFIDPGDGFRF